MLVAERQPVVGVFLPGAQFQGTLEGVPRPSPVVDADQAESQIDMGLRHCRQHRVDRLAERALLDLLQLQAHPRVHPGLAHQRLVILDRVDHIHAGAADLMRSDTIEATKPAMGK